MTEQTKAIILGETTLVVVALIVLTTLVPWKRVLHSVRYCIGGCIAAVQYYWEVIAVLTIRRIKRHIGTGKTRR